MTLPAELPDGIRIAKAVLPAPWKSRRPWNSLSVGPDSQPISTLRSVRLTGGGGMRPPQTIEAIAPVGVTNDSTKAWLEIEYDGTRDLLIHGYVQTK